MLVEDSTFLSNKAKPLFEVSYEHLVFTLSLSGYNTFINAIYSWFDPEFDNVVYWNGTITNTNISNKYAIIFRIDLTRKIFLCDFVYNKFVESSFFRHH